MHYPHKRGVSAGDTLTTVNTEAGERPGGSLDLVRVLRPGEADAVCRRAQRDAIGHARGGRLERRGKCFGACSPRWTSLAIAGTDVTAEGREERLWVFEDARVSPVEFDQLRVWHALRQVPCDGS